MTRPRVRVGIVSWNTAELLSRCLDALPAALGDLDATVVVVDNASTDDSAAAARRPGVTVIVNENNVGYAKAMNQALGNAGADVLVALNPDTEPPPGSLATLVQRLMDRVDVGLVSPALVNPDGSPQHSAYTFPSLRQAVVVNLVPARWQAGRIGRRFWLEGTVHDVEPQEVEWTIGAVHVIRAEAVDVGRPYSERWFMYVEDLDLCWRLSQSGWGRRLEADIRVPHVGGASASQAWVEGPFARWMPASYDWYARARGRLAMRAWAAVNACGVAIRLAGSASAALARRPGAAERARWYRNRLPVHARAVFGAARNVPE